MFHITYQGEFRASLQSLETKIIKNYQTTAGSYESFFTVTL